MPLAASSSPPRVTPALPWVMVLAGGVIMAWPWACAMCRAVPAAGQHGPGLVARDLRHGHGAAEPDLGVAQPFTGMIADRHGSAKVIAAGLVFYAVGLIGMTLAATPAMFVLTAGICVGIALSGTAFAVIYGALSRLVAPERRSWALAVAGAVGGLGQFTLVPAAQG